MQIKDGKYFFLYGGNDIDWIQKFTGRASGIATDANISIELFCVDEQEDKSLISNFWSRIESLFVTKVHKTVDAVTKQVQKILSYKNETGWALFIKGSAVVLNGHGETILQALAEFEKWKEDAAEEGFEITFKIYSEDIVCNIHRCSDLEIPNVAGVLPDSIRCPECPRPMEIYIQFKCCHNESPIANAAHH